MNSSIITIYEPDIHIKGEFFLVWKKMFYDILNSKELIINLFLRDFRVQYKQSILGILWVFINPIIVVSIFVYLNKSGILNISNTTIPYPAFAMIGLTIWNLFSSSIPGTIGSIIAGGNIINKIKFPKISLIIAAFGRSIVDLFLQIILTIIIFIIFSVTPSWTVIFFPFAIIPLVLISFGISAFLSIFTVLFRDIGNFIQIAMSGLMLIMPIVYPAPNSTIFTIINKWNPISHLIVGARDLVINGGLSNPASFFFSSIFSVIIFLLCMRFFYLSELRIAERI